MSCPGCSSEKLQIVKQVVDGKGFYFEEYDCLDCGCGFTWEAVETILEHE